MRRIQRRKSPIDYFFPFLILVSIGIIVVMSLQLWSTWSSGTKADVYFYVADGKAKLLPYGQTDWDSAYSGTRLLLGDSLKTSSFGRLVMDFFNGTIVRIGPDTAVTLADVTKNSDWEKISLNLENGMLWLNGKKSAGVKEAIYEVRTANLLVKAKGTVFEVENIGVETVRVFDGDVEVDVILNFDGKERIVDTVSLGIGQELSIDDATLRAYSQNKKPSIRNAMNDDFKLMEWYIWNTAEDDNPTDFSKPPSTFDDIVDETPATDDVSDGLDDGELDANNNMQNDEELAPPLILQPVNKVVKDEELVISGQAPRGAVKMIVENSSGGVSDSYTLGGYVAGDATFKYTASVKLGNLKSGKNIYKVFAVDADGNRSEPAEIEITLEKEVVEIEEDLEAPKVVSFNGGSSSVVDKGTVVIEGTVVGAEKVVVDDYVLSQFQPGDKTWKYTASVEYENLKPGENVFEVYAVGPDGKKSAVVEFTVTYEGGEEEVEEPVAEAEEPKADVPEIEYNF